MSSTGEDRSLASGIPIPQWMRNKTEHHGFDPSALSPPQHEGDFFYIKLPKSQTSGPSNMKSLSTVLEGNEQSFISNADSNRQFTPSFQDAVQVQKPKIVKPMGMNDGFRVERTASSSSVVEVAHQMLGSKPQTHKLTRGETEGNLIPSASYLRKRRDSKSLPASPLGSPESSPQTARKKYLTFQNRLFGGSLFSSENLNKSDEDIDQKSGSSWILSSLYAAKEGNEQAKELSSEKSVITVEVDAKKAAAYKEGSSDKAKEQVTTSVGASPVSSLSSNTSKVSLLKSKPHLRELNLLTPSSM